MRLKIVSPCPVDFSAMRQDGEARFCDRCNKHVYDLTCLSPDEVRAFVSKRGRICGRVLATTLALTGCSAADQATAPAVVLPVATTATATQDAAVQAEPEYLLGKVEEDTR